MSILKYRLAGSAVAGLLVGLLLLTACGDNTATSSAVGAAPTGAGVALTPPAGATTLASSAATTAVNAATTAAGATTTAAGAATSAAAAVANSAANAAYVPTAACLDPGATAPAANGPKPTTTSSVVATLPNLAYNGTREIKATDATTKAILANLNSPNNATAFGKFTADKIVFNFSSDAYDKVEASYRKLLEGEGWQLFKNESDAPTKQSLIVYQKESSKIVISLTTVDDISSYPPEFKDGFQKGDTLILLATGRSTGGAAEPTPFAIPGPAQVELKAGQKKIATIEMEKGGKIVIELCPNLAPRTVENFEKLATKGFFNNLTFHRVEKDPKPFVVQGGDPKGDGTGGPGYQIPDEFTTQKKHLRGTVAMAHSQAANSAGSQFYICLDAAPFLDGKYAIFGQVVEGMDTVVDKIAIGDKMKSITISVQ